MVERRTGPVSQPASRRLILSTCRWSAMTARRTSSIPWSTLQARRAHRTYACGAHACVRDLLDQARVDIDLDDGDVVDGLQVIWTPGHTAGSIALRHGERGVLFTGDTAAERAGGVFLGPFNTDRERAKESFRRLAERGVTTVCFGHGDPLLDDRARLPAAAAGEAEVPDPLG